MAIEQESGQKAVNVLLLRWLAPTVDLVDHLLHREGQQREGRLEDVEDLLDELPGLARLRNGRRGRGNSRRSRGWRIRHGSRSVDGRGLVADRRLVVRSWNGRRS